MIFGNLLMKITINTLISAAQKIIYRNMQNVVLLASAQVRRKLYNQSIKDNSLAKFLLDEQNKFPLKNGTPLKMNFVIIDCKLIKLKSVGLCML